jgi:hypothetical protein
MHSPMRSSNEQLAADAIDVSLPGAAAAAAACIR